MSGIADRDVIFEFTQVGSLVRVCAVDVETGMEAVSMGPVNTARFDLERLAGAKLARLLRQAGVLS